MKIYQIIYNSSASTINGRSGFGVRIASEGTPQEYIDIINNNSALRSYSSGKFNIPSNVILASPERIFEYPQGYYFRILKIKDKTVYLLGRVVSTCFDHSFYVTGKATRSGNYVAHIFLSEDFPGKEIFNLLEESAGINDIHFIPKDWTPIQTNQELVELMVGKSQQILPIYNGEFLHPTLTWDAKSLDLLFSYRLALKEHKPIVVSLESAISATTVSKFMNLLPESLIKESTFVINHQAEGHAKDVRITFVNEYYQYTIYPNLCSYINLLDNSRQIDNLEILWRPVLEKALQGKDIVQTNRLINWIFSHIAEDNIDSSALLNKALFNYSLNPSIFTLRTIDEDGNVLQAIAKYVKHGDLNTNRLNELIVESVKIASSLNDFAKIINYCEQMCGVDLDISSAKSYLQTQFTNYLIQDCNLIYEAFVSLKETILSNYSIVRNYPKFEVVLSEVLSRQTDVIEVSRFAKFLERNAHVRVLTYVNLLNQSPELLPKYLILLDSDKEEADKMDYIRLFKSHLYNPTFGYLFYRQILNESRVNASIELTKKIFDLSEINEGFTKYILKDNQIFNTIYASVIRKFKQEDCGKVLKAIETNIFSLLLVGNRFRVQWQLLYDVLNLKLENKKNILSFYELAKEIGYLEALKKVAPLCFEVLDEDQIEEFLNLVKQHSLMTDSEIVDFALSKKSKHHLTYILKVADMYDYDYDTVFDLVSKCERDKKEQKKIMKAKFPTLYSKHRRKVFISKIKSLFMKK